MEYGGRPGPEDEATADMGALEDEEIENFLRNLKSMPSELSMEFLALVQKKKDGTLTPEEQARLTGILRSGDSPEETPPGMLDKLKKTFRSGGEQRSRFQWKPPTEESLLRKVIGKQEK